MTSGKDGPILRVLEDPDDAADALARFLVEEIRDCVDRSGHCSLALSGGGTPRLLYERLAQPDLARVVPWDAVRLYWSDERCVPSDDASSNYALAREALIRHVPLAPSNIHPVDGALPPEAAAAAYEALLGPDPLDIVLLGMGGDGHTASLFPGGPEVQSNPEITSRTVIATRSPLPPPDRVSLSLRAINQARRVVFFVVGADKASRVSKVLAEFADGPSPATQPAAMVRPAPGALYWFLDQGAAGSIQSGHLPS